MRQAWINNLWDLLAELSSTALHYYLAGFEERSDGEYQRVSLLESKVWLMLNANEDDHHRLETLIRQMIAAIQHEKGKKDEFSDLHRNVVQLSKADTISGPSQVTHQ